jgi:polyisoprenoid-binding protein YceI
MKKLILAIALLNSFTGYAQKYMTKTGSVDFSATSSIEKIEGTDKSVACLLDAQTATLNLVIQVKSFVFEKQLMQEHFNENYMETDLYPKATFRGTLGNIKSIDFTKDGEYPTTTNGKLSIHGVTKDVQVKGKVIVKGNKPTLQASFSVLLSDYNILIPGPVKDKISKDARIAVNCALEPMK